MNESEAKPPVAEGAAARRAETILRVPAAAILEDIPWLALATDSDRKIIWMNRAARKALDDQSAIGVSPGEAVGCVNAALPAGCGKTPMCAFCGLNAAVESAVDGSAGLERCVIQRDEAHGADPVEFLVWSKPVEVDGETVVFLTARDTSEERRHEVLERVFYHDIGNTVAGLKWLTELIAAGDQSKEFIMLLHSAAEQLSEEIESQRGLKAAEEGRLGVEKRAVPVRGVIEEAISILRYQLHGKGVEIVFGGEDGGRGDGSEVGPEAYVDPVLLRRVVVNMLKNALEASRRGDSVKVSYGVSPSSVEIAVWNPAVMDPESRDRVFQRSFSTKGRGRGLGTYSMKLLCERYLDGAIGFSSEPGQGTTFIVAVPRRAGRRGKGRARPAP